MMQDPKADGPSGAGCLVRLYWMLFGNGLLWLLLAIFASKRPRFPSILDALYWLVVVSLILARYVDIRYQNGMTAYGDDPATLKHWRRYALLTVVAALVGWVAAHALGRFLG